VLGPSIAAASLAAGIPLAAFLAAASLAACLAASLVVDNPLAALGPCRLWWWSWFTASF